MLFPDPSHLGGGETYFGPSDRSTLVFRLQIIDPFPVGVRPVFTDGHKVLAAVMDTGSASTVMGKLSQRGFESRAPFALLLHCLDEWTEARRGQVTCLGHTEAT